MYQVAIRKELVAFHKLFGGDWGKENERHSHDYVVEVIVEGPGLDHHGYLFDISVMRVALDALCAKYEGKMLNDFDELRDLNPSVERFAKVIAEQLRGATPAGISTLTIKIWEDKDAWASFRLPLA